MTKTLGGMLRFFKVNPAPWFQWNGTDLSQFGSTVAGDGVTASNATVVTYGGMNWVDLTVTGNGAGVSGIRNGFILPIIKTPPSIDYAIAFDFVSRQVIGNTVGAGAVLRFLGLDEGYYCRYNNRSSAPIQDFGRMIAGPALERYEDLEDPYLDGLDRGCRMAMMVENIDENGVLVKMVIGEQATYLETDPYNSVGQAGLFQTTSGAVGTTRNYYRNIKCYLASDLKSFEL